jgi:Fe-Mn family superoxide dismutase
MLMFDRRRFIAAAGAGAVAGLFDRGWAQTAAGPFTLPPLGYAADALEPHIDATTMQIHHDRHHAAYVDGLNTAVKNHPAVAAMPLQDILVRLGEMPEGIRTALRNSGGGHANHTMFWQIMGPNGG